MENKNYIVDFEDLKNGFTTEKNYFDNYEDAKKYFDFETSKNYETNKKYYKSVWLYENNEDAAMIEPIDKFYFND